MRRLVSYLKSLIIFALSALLAFELRFDGALPARYLHAMEVALCIWAIAKTAAFFIGAVNQEQWRHTSIYEAERIVLKDDAENPLTDVKVLLLGARRVDELTGETRAVFLGHHNEILNPAWMSWCVREFRDRPVRDLAVRLVNDMLAQANRVALEKMEPDASGRLQVYSRVFERNGRYYKTGDEGDSPLGTRLEVIAGIAAQLGLIDVAPDGAATLTDLGFAVLEAGA